MQIELLNYMMEKLKIMCREGFYQVIAFGIIIVFFMDIKKEFRVF